MHVVTHDKTFHLDEVTGFALLNSLSTRTLTRTRNPAQISRADIVIDVGGQYDHETRRYDHHQDECHEVMPGFNTPLSSAGMVWRHYGRAYIKKIISEQFNSSADLMAKIPVLHRVFYRQFIQGIDAADNGITSCDHRNQHKFHDVTLSTTVAKLNGDVDDDEEQMRAFHMAVSIVSAFLQIHMSSLLAKNLTRDKDYLMVVEAMKERPEDEILVLNGNCPNWAGAIMAYERKHDIVPIKYVVFPAGNEWRIKTLNAGFNPRRPIAPEDVLVDNMENPSAFVFVHRKLFIAGARTARAAVNIAQISLIFEE